MMASAAGAMDVIPLVDNARIEPKESRSYAFRLKDAEVRQVRLHFEARFDWDSLFGYTQGLRVTVNGQPVTGNRLLNKPLAYKVRSGGGNRWAGPDGHAYMIMYSPDFSDRIKTDESFQYGLYEEDQEPYRFVFDLSGLTQHVGSNTVAFEGIYAPVIVRSASIEIDEHRLPRINDPAHMVQPAPAGPLADCRLKPRLRPDPGLVIRPGTGMSVVVNGADYPLSSRLSLPGGKWLDARPGGAAETVLRAGGVYEIAWDAGTYRVQRRLEVRADHVKVFDTFVNLRDELTGVAFEHRLGLPAAAARVLRGGLDSRLDEVRRAEHPTVLAEGDGFCAGLAAEDDILRNQGYFRSEANAVVLGNRSLGLPPNGSHTQEWSLYVLPDGTYDEFVNAVRRAWGSNFTMEGVLDFPYMGGGKPLARWNKKELKESDVEEFLAERPVRMLMTHVASDITVPASQATPEKPFLGHGTAILHFTWWGAMTRNMIALFKRVAPEIKIYAYLHKNLCSEFGHEEKYPDSLARDPDSLELMAKDKIYGRYVPTVSNSYGRALARTYRYLVDDLDAHIYLDEICLSVTAWAPYPEWDGCTVELDPETHAVVRKLSIPNLLVKPWLEEMIGYLKARDKELMANGPPVTRTLLDHHYPHFVEEGMGESGLIAAHLATPLAWSYARGREGFRHFRDSLDFGALAMTWSGDWSLQAFPFTPLEIRPGYVIGEERIVTRRSGRFGWRDNSGVEIFVYDGEGNPVAEPDVKTVAEDGENTFEVRMPSDHVAILVRTRGPRP